MGRRNGNDQVVTSFDKNILAFECILDIRNNYEIYCNTTTKRIVRNEYFIYVPNAIIENTKKVDLNEKNVIAVYNMDSIAEPDYGIIQADIITSFNMSEGIFYIIKLYDNITLLQD